MDNITGLLPYMFHELPGCPEPMQKQLLNLAARDFCVASEAWRVELDPIDVVADTNEYDLVSGYNANIIRIESVKIGENVSDSTDTTTPTSPALYKLKDEFTLVLLNTPVDAITDGLVVVVRARPMVDQDVYLPVWFLDRYGDAIANKAKSRLMLQSGKPWSDKEMGIYYSREYDRVVTEAKMDNVWQQKSADIYITPRDFV